MEINGQNVSETGRYDEMGLSAEVMQAIDRKGYVQATPVQVGAIPYFMEWKDVIAKAPTGTGKTFAFGIPMVEHTDPAGEQVTGLVLAPTRELAIQIRDELRDLCAFKEGVRVVCLYGGQPIDKQITQLKKRPQIVVATPGRLMDHMKRRTVRLDKVETVVLDEADRMLDMGFVRDVTHILDTMPQRRNLGMFSATISREVLELLGSCGVTAIELGAQSLDDGVLFRNGRGHTAEDVRRAVAAIRESRFRFSLGLQIMAGLHGDSREIWERTVEEVLQLKPDTLRIYPTVVLRGTGLEQLTREGLYTPLTVEEAVDWVAPVLPRLEAAGIRVIRVGLHASRSLEERLVAGAYHPAFRELCQGRLYREKLAAELEKYPPGTALELFAAPRELSKAAGQKRENLRWAEERGYRLKLRPDEELAAGELRISPKTP